MNVSNEAAAAAASRSREHLSEAAKAAGEGFRQAADGLRSASRKAGEELSEAGAAASRGAQDMMGQAEDAIRRNPLAAAGIAFAAGLVISRLLR